VFEGNKFIPKNSSEKETETKEGVAALDDLISYLNALSESAEEDTRLKLDPIPLRQGLVKAAEDNAKDQADQAKIDHTGSDGSTYLDRMKRYGKPDGETAEIIYSGWKNGSEAFIHVLIDDGDSKRTQRKMVMNQNFNAVGVSHYDNKKDNGDLVVAVYAQEFTDKDPDFKPATDAGKEPCLYDRLGRLTECRSGFTSFLDGFNHFAKYADLWEKSVQNCYATAELWRDKFICSSCDPANDTAFEKTEGMVLDSFKLNIKARSMNDLIEACV
jgi:hypothetical protein